MRTTKRVEVMEHPAALVFRRASDAQAQALARALAATGDCAADGR